MILRSNSVGLDYVAHCESFDLDLRCLQIQLLLLLALSIVTAKSSIIVPQCKSKGTIVMGSSVRPSIRLSVCQKTQSCLRNSSYSFQGILMKLSSYCSHDLKMCILYSEVTLDRFLPELWPFISFGHFINRSSCLRNSSYSFQGIFMKVSRYCCHDLKMHILYRGHARLIFTRVMAL